MGDYWSNVMLIALVAVQWHPERQRPEVLPEGVVDGVKIMEYFINLCKGEKY